MGASMSEEDYVTKLINQSNSTLSSELVYQIIMKSGCTRHADKAGELLQLYTKFQALDTDKKGALSNSQLLQMDEFLYNPFKSRLHKAIPFRPDDYILKFRHSVTSTQTIFDAPTAAQNTPNTDARKPTQSGKVAPEETKVDNLKEVGPPPSEIDRIPYIDFEQFAVYLSVFCQRSPIDQKANCNVHSVLFRIYDLDGDERLSPQDIAGTLKLVTGEAMSAPEIEEVVNKIFDELGGREMKMIDKDTFQNVLWATDFLPKMTFHFS